MIGVHIIKLYNFYLRNCNGIKSKTNIRKEATKIRRVNVRKKIEERIKYQAKIRLWKAKAKSCQYSINHSDRLPPLTHSTFQYKEVDCVPVQSRNLTDVWFSYYTHLLTPQLCYYAYDGIHSKPLPCLVNELIF